MTRQEHLQWCKQRAMEYCDNGDLKGAMASFASDLTKHDDTSAHPAILLGVQLMLTGNLSTKSDMKHFIEGTN